MTSEALLTVVALAGWLILAASSYRAHRVGARRTLVMALAWGAIFLAAAAVFTVVT